LELELELKSPLELASRRRVAERRGRDAEAAVAASWCDRGFEVLGRRARTGRGEIDLVVADPDMLVFIEVKARKSLVEAVYAVAPRQQARLLAAAESLLAAHRDWERPATRFDVALVCGDRIEQIEDAIRYN
jgi:putative endonuclease